MDDHDYELVAQHVSGLSHKVSGLEGRLSELEKVIGQLEAAALTTSRAMQEISRHWDAVYEAMRREEEADPPGELGEALRPGGYEFTPRESERT